MSVSSLSIIKALIGHAHLSLSELTSKRLIATDVRHDAQLFLTNIATDVRHEAQLFLTNVSTADFYDSVDN